MLLGAGGIALIANALQQFNSVADPVTDTVVPTILAVTIESGSTATVEECVPSNESGDIEPTGEMRTVRFDGRGKESLEALLDAGHQGPLFLGSAMMSRDVWRVGPWCDVLPWAPIPDSGRS